MAIESSSKIHKQQRAKSTMEAVTSDETSFVGRKKMEDQFLAVQTASRNEETKFLSEQLEKLKETRDQIEALKKDLSEDLKKLT